MAIEEELLEQGRALATARGLALRHAATCHHWP